MAQMNLSNPQNDEKKEQRYQTFRYQHLNEMVYEQAEVEVLRPYLKIAMRRFSPAALGFTDDRYFQLADAAVWTMGDMDVVMQMLTAMSPEHMGMDFEQYRTYRAMVNEHAQNFVKFRTESEPTIRKAFEEIESAIDRSVDVVGQA